MLVFIILHITGVFLANNNEEKGIISNMVIGDTDNIE